MSTFYHLTMTRLEAGSVIRPGNWGRLLHRYEHQSRLANGGLFGQTWVLCRELIFENARLRVDPDLPSRFDAAFVFEDIGSVERYRSAQDPHRAQVLHEVRLQDAAAPTHRGALAMISYPPVPEFLGPMTQQAEAYWRGEGSGDTELLTLSSLEVVQCLE